MIKFNVQFEFQDSDAMILKNSKQLDQLASEKEVITTQTTRKNDEIGLLNQKINNMQLCLDRSIHIIHHKYLEITFKKIIFQQVTVNTMSAYKISMY